MGELDRKIARGSVEIGDITMSSSAIAAVTVICASCLGVGPASDVVHCVASAGGTDVKRNVGFDLDGDLDGLRGKRWKSITGTERSTGTD